MKKFLFMALVTLFAVSAARAQTLEEKLASVERIHKLQADAPKNCGEEKIDELVAKCKSVAAATVKVNELTWKFKGYADTGQLAALVDQIKCTHSEFIEIKPLFGVAVAAMMKVEDPQKAPSVIESISYAKDVVMLVEEEFVYQNEVIAGINKGK